jgi:Ubiquitin family
MTETIDVVIKPTGQSSDKPDRCTVTVATDATILQLKEEVAKHGEIPADEQRLIYKGQILKDQKTVSDYGAWRRDSQYTRAGTEPGIFTVQAYSYHAPPCPCAGIGDQHVVHMVKGRKGAAASTTYVPCQCDIHHDASSSIG